MTCGVATEPQMPLFLEPVPGCRATSRIDDRTGKFQERRGSITTSDVVVGSGRALQETVRRRISAILLAVRGKSQGIGRPCGFALPRW